MMKIGRQSHNGSILILTLLLAACSGQNGDVAPANDLLAVPSNAADMALPGPTVGGDRSEIVLSGLSAADLDAVKLSGELACSFTDPAGAVLLFAKGDVASAEAARGVVKVGSYIEDIAVPGGFDAMIKGAIFSGKGKDVRILLTGPAQGGGESPPHPATLTYDRADGGRRVFPGVWTCGP